MKCLPIIFLSLPGRQKDVLYENILESSGSGITIFDFNNDDFPDLYMLNGTYLEGISDAAGKVFKNTRNKLYKNNGDGTFSDITESSGLKGPEMLNGFVKWSVGVAFWDFNSDNKIDAMVGNFLAFDPAYVSPTTPDMMPHPSEYKG